MSFTITGLDPAPFVPLYGLSDAELAAHGASRHTVDDVPGYPDRVELCDAALGERVLLLNYTHQPAANAYRASHAIYVREGATRAYAETGAIPSALAIRPISLRGYDGADMMIAADLVDGSELTAAIERFFADPAVAYLHAHYAKRGCYAARVDRTA